MPEQGTPEPLGKYGRCAMGAGCLAAYSSVAGVGQANALSALGRSGVFRYCRSRRLVVEAEAQPAAPADGDHGAGGHDAGPCRSRATGAVTRRAPAGLPCHWQRWEEQAMATAA